MSQAPRILTLLGSSSDLPVTEGGLSELEALGLPYSLRICSAHRTPDMLHDIVRGFEKEGGQIYICIAGMSAHLAGVVASLTHKPVIAVPVYRPETSGMDALLSMGQMPKGIPVATMGFGKHGYINACLFAAQALAVGDEALARKLAAGREKMAAGVRADDERNRRDFTP